MRVIREQIETVQTLSGTEYRWLYVLTSRLVLTNKARNTMVAILMYFQMSLKAASTQKKYIIRRILQIQLLHISWSQRDGISVLSAISQSEVNWGLCHVMCRRGQKQSRPFANTKAVARRRTASSTKRQSAFQKRLGSQKKTAVKLCADLWRMEHALLI